MIRRHVKVLSVGIQNVTQVVKRMASSDVPRFEFKDLDDKWRKQWLLDKEVKSFQGSHRSDHLKEKKDFYSLVMFPYPSGKLHLGHLRVYTISDVIARYKKMQGFNVINPMGWDAFGLPAENAAVERGIDPAIWTEQNIATMKEQMQCFLADFDWDREISTCSPEYYKWTQKIFLMLFEKGLAYQKEAEINWDPIDKTVLANEQVDSEGRSWRSGALVEKKFLKQWFIGITKYADRLVDDLKDLEGWPQHVKTMQKNWIGRSKGLQIDFPISEGNPLSVYTTRPETVFCAQFIAISLNHPLVLARSRTDGNLARFLKECKNAELDSKIGYKLPDLKASIPINTDNSKRTKFDIPIYVAPYVLNEYGSGAVMGCPGHDRRDFEFWSLHEPSKQITQVMGPETGETEIPYEPKVGIMQDRTTLVKSGLDSLGSYTGISADKARSRVSQAVASLGVGKESTNYRLKDWLISRQRYWGAPIPIIHCESCGPVVVPDSQLPVLLPKVEQHHFEKGNPLENVESFVSCTCPSCGSKKARRETDTMDTFMDSSWYFLRYLDPHNSKELISREAGQSMPVDLYIGGVEHAILHLLYSRFIAKFLNDEGVWKGKFTKDEPIVRLITQGMVHGKTYIDPQSERFLKPEELDFVNPKAPVIKQTGKHPKVTFEKMSKSKHNGADPQECIQKYGADATRAQILFLAPVSDTLQWDEKQILGVDRWLRKVFKLADSFPLLADEMRQTSNSDAIAKVELQFTGSKESLELGDREVTVYNEVQNLVKSINLSLNDVYSLNTVVSDLMKITNAITKVLGPNGCNVNPVLVDELYRTLLICMAPITPVTAEECWFRINNSGKGNCTRSTVFDEEFPTGKVLKTRRGKFNVIINGRPRGSIVTDQNLLEQSEEQLLKTLRLNRDFSKHLGGDIRKIITKKGLVSIVTLA